MSGEKNTKSYKGTTFIVEVMSKENHSWQGKLTWVEEKQSSYFRSVLELMRLMDSVVDEDEKE